MLTKNEAEETIKSRFPECTIKAGVEFKNRYLFVVYRDDTVESLFDPFYYVDKTTGEFRDFSIIDDPDSKTIFTLLQTFIDKEEG